MRPSRHLLACMSVVATLVTLAGCGATGTVAPVAVIDTTPPSIPDGLNQSYDPAISIAKLHWSPSASPDVTGYEVYMYQPDPSRENAFVKVGDCTDPDAGWALPTSATEKSYSVRVRAVDGAGNRSGYSATFDTTVPSFQPAGGGGGGGFDDEHRKRTDS